MLYSFLHQFLNDYTNVADLKVNYMYVCADTIKYIYVFMRAAGGRVA
jgi:hypothetical protein